MPTIFTFTDCYTILILYSDFKIYFNFIGFILFSCVIRYGSQWTSSSVQETDDMQNKLSLKIGHLLLKWITVNLICNVEKLSSLKWLRDTHECAK